MLQKHLINLTFFASILILAACQKNIDADQIDPLDPSKALQLQNISYGLGVRNKADVYLPANRSISSTACIIMLHGGSWVAGDKSDNNQFIPLIQQALHVIVKTSTYFT